MINDVLTWLPVTHSDPISDQMEMSEDVSGGRCPDITGPVTSHPLMSLCHNVNIPHILITIFSLSSQLSVLILSNSNSDSLMSSPGPSFRPPGMLLSSSEILCFQTPDIILHKV